MFRLDTSWHSLTVGSFHKELKRNGSFLKIRENIKLARIQINTSSLPCLSTSALTLGTDAAISVSETTQHKKPSSVWLHGGPPREKSFKFIFILWLLYTHTHARIYIFYIHTFINFWSFFIPIAPSSSSLSHWSSSQQVLTILIPLFSFIENRSLFHTIHSVYSFPSPYFSQCLPTSPLIWIQAFSVFI